MVGGLCPYCWTPRRKFLVIPHWFVGFLWGEKSYLQLAGRAPYCQYMYIYIYIISNVVGYVCANFLVPIYPFFVLGTFFVGPINPTCRRRWAWTLLTVAWHVFERICIFLRAQVFVVLVFRHVSCSWRVSSSWHVAPWFYSSSCCCCCCSCSSCSCSCSCSSYSLCLICVFKVSLDCSVLSMMDECFAGDGLGAVCGVFLGLQNSFHFCFGVPYSLIEN